MIASTFLGLHTVLDSSPAPTRPEIAARVHRIPAQRLARDPHVTGVLGKDFGFVRVHFFPALLAHHHMDRQMFVSVLVPDPVYPPELLPTSAPNSTVLIVPLPRAQPLDLLPYRRQTLVRQHDHVLPAIVATLFHHRTVRVQPVEQHHHRQARKVLLEPLSQAFEGLALAILLVLVRILVLVRVPFAIAEKFTHQRDRQAVVKRQVGLEHVDVLLHLLALGMLMSALQPLLVPPLAVAHQLLRAVNRDGIALFIR
jgi:hypothetical protein